MPTYLYETIPASCCEEPKHYEIQQGTTDALLTHHPETGEPIKRVVLGGYGAAKADEPSASADGGCGCGPSGCC
ncbi:MAG: zinc ribbon domain-containing protein [Chthoniobacter sp.]|uniref:zinc ribbon domain-containing protein n=1 Tax=Chthoniobacter sp. TaxID=2510640 RepID=UPI0032A780C7